MNYKLNRGMGVGEECSRLPNCEYFGLLFVLCVAAVWLNMCAQPSFVINTVGCDQMFRFVIEPLTVESAREPFLSVVSSELKLAPKFRQRFTPTKPKES
jgi:hypothetical protein